MIDEAKVSHHTLAGLKEGKRIADASLMKLFRAAEALRQEADPIAAAMDKALKDLRRLRDMSAVGTSSPSCLASPAVYRSCAERGKPMTEELLERLAKAATTIAMAAVSRKP